MAPKPSSTEITDAGFAFVFSVLKHSAEIKPDWKAVAEEHNISHARNATARFHSTLKKLGYRYEAGKITSIDAAPTNRAPAAHSTPKKPIKAKKKGTTSNKNRKLDVTEDEDAADDDDDVQVKDEAEVKDEATA